MGSERKRETTRGIVHSNTSTEILKMLNNWRNTAFLLISGTEVEYQGQHSSLEGRPTHYQ